jgi:hypothetical protein
LAEVIFASPWNVGSGRFAPAAAVLRQVTDAGAMDHVIRDLRNSL